MLNRRILTVGMVGLLTISMVGCGNKTETETETNTTQQEQQVVANVDINRMMESILNEYQEKMPIGTPLDAESIPYLYEETMTEDMYEEFAGFIPMMVSSSEVTIFKAKEGQVDAVKSALEKRQANQIQAFEQYLPDQYDIVKESKIFVNGNYVYFISAEPENFEGIKALIEETLK